MPEKCLPAGAGSKPAAGQPSPAPRQAEPAEMPMAVFPEACPAGEAPNPSQGASPSLPPLPWLTPNAAWGCPGEEGREFPTGETPGEPEPCSDQSSDQSRARGAGMSLWAPPEPGQDTNKGQSLRVVIFQPLRPDPLEGRQQIRMFSPGAPNPQPLFPREAANQTQRQNLCFGSFSGATTTIQELFVLECLSLHCQVFSRRYPTKFTCKV